jgi:ATP-dependent Clp protease adaptor protein ClpS
MRSNLDLEELIEEVVETKQKADNILVLFSDEVNTFEHVITCLTVVCDHNPIQAEQCALIAHQNGKCVIKKGNYLSLEKMKYRLIDNDLVVEIQ